MSPAFLTLLCLPYLHLPTEGKISSSRLWHRLKWSRVPQLPLHPAWIHASVVLWKMLAKIFRLRHRWFRESPQRERVQSLICLSVCLSTCIKGVKKFIGERKCSYDRHGQIVSCPENARLTISAVYGCYDPAESIKGIAFMSMPQQSVGEKNINIKLISLLPLRPEWKWLVHF